MIHCKIIHRAVMTLERSRTGVEHDGLLIEEVNLLETLMQAWQRASARERTQGFLVEGAGTGSAMLTHPGLSDGRLGVPVLHLGDLEKAGLLAYHRNPRFPELGPIGAYSITAKGRLYVESLVVTDPPHGKQNQAAPDRTVAGSTQNKRSVLKEASDAEENRMDFVAWCGLFLDRLLDAQDQDSHGSSIGIDIDVLAKLLFPEHATPLDSPTRRQAIFDALRTFTDLGLLVQGTSSRYLRVPRQHRHVARNPSLLWSQVCAQGLDQDELALLRALNRHAEHREKDHAYLVEVAYEDLYTDLDLDASRGSNQSIERTVRDLQSMGLAKRGRTNGYQASSTYSGLVRESRCQSTAIAAKNSRNAMNVEPIWTGRGYAVDEHLCFVLMPFKEPFNTIYRDHIKPVVESVEGLGLRCMRADDIYGVRPIMEDVWEQICRAQVLIAEATERNPNVFYELGMAHTLGKQVILITQSMDDVPFDLRSHRHIVYAYTPPGVQQLQEGLAKTLLSVLGPRR